LIQTIGRAARNINGKAILYADKLTDSMRAAIEETDRRRKIQNEFNIKNNIQPRTIRKDISDIITRQDVHNSDETELLSEIEKELQISPGMSKKTVSEILRNAMLAAAKNLEFEKAALIRDKLNTVESGEKTGNPNKTKGKISVFRPKKKSRKKEK